MRFLKSLLHLAIRFLPESWFPQVPSPITVIKAVAFSDDFREYICTSKVSAFIASEWLDNNSANFKQFSKQLNISYLWICYSCNIQNDRALESAAKFQQIFINFKDNIYTLQSIGKIKKILFDQVSFM
jgi:hypothetical protein